MRVEKFPLRSAGFEIDDDNQVARATCEVTVIRPAADWAGGGLLLQVELPSGQTVPVKLSHDQLAE